MQENEKWSTCDPPDPHPSNIHFMLELSWNPSTDVILQKRAQITACHARIQSHELLRGDSITLFSPIAVLALLHSTIVLIAIAHNVWLVQLGPFSTLLPLPWSHHWRVLSLSFRELHRRNHSPGTDSRNLVLPRDSRPRAWSGRMCQARRRSLGRYRLIRLHSASRKWIRCTACSRDGSVGIPER